MGVVRGVDTWHGHMMLHFMVVVYNHFEGTKLANLSSPPKNLLSKPVPLYLDSFHGVIRPPLYCSLLPELNIGPVSMCSWVQFNVELCAGHPY